MYIRKFINSLAWLCYQRPKVITYGRYLHLMQHELLIESAMKALEENFALREEVRRLRGQSHIEIDED